MQYIILHKNMNDHIYCKKTYTEMKQLYFWPDQIVVQKFLLEFINTLWKSPWVSQTSTKGGKELSSM